MCDKGLKYGRYISISLLLIACILFCVTFSCDEEGLYWSEWDYFWTTKYRGTGWKDKSLCDDSCLRIRSLVGTLSIICILILIVTVIILTYLRCNKNKTFSTVNQRRSVIVVCLLCTILLLPTSVAYAVYYQDPYFWQVLEKYGGIDSWGVDYGLIVTWVGCLILFITILINFAPWVEDDDKDETSQTTTATASNSNQTNNLQLTETA